MAKRECPAITSRPKSRRPSKLAFEATRAFGELIAGLLHHRGGVEQGEGKKYELNGTSYLSREWKMVTRAGVWHVYFHGSSVGSLYVNSRFDSPEEAKALGIDCSLVGKWNVHIGHASEVSPEQAARFWEARYLAKVYG